MVGLLVLGIYVMAYYRDYGKGKPLNEFIKKMSLILISFFALVICIWVIMKFANFNLIVLTPIVLMLWVLCFNKPAVK